MIPSISLNSLLNQSSVENNRTGTQVNFIETNRTETRLSFGQNIQRPKKNHELYKIIINDVGLKFL